MGHVGDGSADEGLSRQELLRRGGLAGAGLIGVAGLLGTVGPAFAAKTGAKPVRSINHVVAGGIALTTNRYRMTLKPPGGKTEKITGGGIEVARRGDDGGWRFIVDDTSRVAQAPA